MTGTATGGLAGGGSSLLGILEQLVLDEESPTFVGSAFTGGLSCFVEAVLKNLRSTRPKCGYGSGHSL
jgi:hypothetical protein